MHFNTVVAETTAQQRGNELCIQFFLCVIIRVSFLPSRSCVYAKPLKIMALKKVLLRAVKAEKFLPLLQN